MKTLTQLLLLFLSTSCAFGNLTEKDRQLNECIEAFPPVYSSAKRIPWSFWSTEYEFALELINPEPLSLKPVSDINTFFMGYRNRGTKVRIVCKKLDPTFEKVLSTDVVGVYDLDDIQTTIPYKIKDMDKQNEVQVNLKIQRDKLDILVTDSGKFMGLFKSYKPARVFLVNFDIKQKT